MSLFRLALANLNLSRLSSAMNVILLALGTASIATLLLASAQLSSALTRNAAGIDLVIGAKGSPLQLVLAGVYHADVPPGNIPLSEMSRWQRHPMVKRAIPISVGDSFNGYRIVGTTPDFAALYDAEILAGEYWHAPFQAVIGSQVAATTNLTIGSQFDGVHGLTDGGDRHEQSSYQVVGQLVKTGSVLDRLVFTSLESVWQMHGDHRARDHSQEKAIASEHENAHEHQDEHQDQQEEAHEHENARRQEHASNASADFSNHEADREITMILIKFSSPLGMLTLPREVNETSSLQAAAPALEIARLVQVVGVGLNWLNAFAAILVLSAALSILAALYASLRARRQGLAVLRCLGATRWELFYLLYIEGMLLTIAGTCLGLVLAHGGMTLLGIVLGAGQGLVLSGWTWASGEFVLVVGMLSVGALTALLPALQAYRTNVAATLTSG
jgi:putative ABC transport system permease protein|tara:strand:- start:54 stop:1385 length:1332 start_codon:yes stop_codon:yes gene_type:complete